MTEANTWLLPDGMADILPHDAVVRETMRRQLLDTMLAHGYQMVEPPLIEYTESLLNCASEELKRQTFRIVDQLTGRLMGVRADITHQVARIDAHVLPTEKVSRFCYCSQVLHTKPKTTFASRTPMQVGSEIYGHQGISADIEALNLMMTMLQKIKVYPDIANATDNEEAQQKNNTKPSLHINFGNVAIFKTLVTLSGIDENTETQLLNFLQRKALPELKQFCEVLSHDEQLTNTEHANDFYMLAVHAQNMELLLQSLSSSATQHEALRYAIYDLKRLESDCSKKWPNCHVSIDAGEVSSYHYHTGIVFTLYGDFELSHVPNNRVNSVLKLAQGGRYDGIGKNFGRNRCATGFSCDLENIYAYSQVCNIVNKEQQSSKKMIAAPALNNDEFLQDLVQQARLDGHIVVNKLSEKDGAGATHEYMIIDKQWQLVEL